jgi:hypothetical protein
MLVCGSHIKPLIDIILVSKCCDFQYLIILHDVKVFCFFSIILGLIYLENVVLIGTFQVC